MIASELAATFSCMELEASKNPAEPISAAEPPAAGAPAAPLPVSAPPALACETVNLTKAFGATKAVDHLNLRVPQGLLYGFLGANGAGKTTTLRMIAGLLRPTSGDVRILGVGLAADPTEAKRPLAYVPDDPVLYAKLNALEYLEFVAALWAIPSATAQERSHHLLTALGLAGDRTRRIEEYSRGMKQKLALIAALVHDPRVMLLDEPLTGLDAASARVVKDLLLAFVRGGGTVILTTHILDVAERLAEKIGIIHHGRLVAEGTLAELRTQAGQGNTLEDVFLELTREPASGS
jgi:ABC-2 type transport system ATP-binding protein